MNKRWYTMKAAPDGGAEIFLMDDIGGWGVSAQEFRVDLSRFDEAAPITLRVHSDGGDFFDGLSMYHFLKGRKGPVNAVVMGLAASAATLPLMAANTVTMPANTFMMVHKPMTGRMGNSSEIEETLEVLRMMDSSVESIYAAKTGKTKEQIAAMLPNTSNPGLWLTAEDAKANGFADEISDPIEGVSMSADSIGRLSLVPSQFIAQAKKTVADARLDEICSISDLEAFLREAGGFSKKLTTAVVSKAKALALSDSAREEAEQAGEIISLLNNSLNIKGI